MTGFAIRQYNESDLEPCRCLWVDLVQRHRDLYGDPTIGGEDPGQHFDKHLSRVGDANIWVAEDNGEVIGMVGLIPEDMEIEPIVVTPKHRNEGVGSKLLEHVIDKAKESGLLYLNITPVVRNREAISLFHRTGFKLLGHIDMFMDLRPEPRKSWKSGPDILGLSFEH
jgi:GNAT superfamily N-acetyltransferase